MNVKTKTPIKEFSGRIIGYIEEDYNGDQQIRDFYGKILGTYNKSRDITQDFYGRIKGNGNLLMMFLNQR